jgi:hypothetical protein
VRIFWRGMDDARQCATDGTPINVYRSELLAYRQHVRRFSASMDASRQCAGRHSDHVHRSEIEPLSAAYAVLLARHGCRAATRQEALHRCAAICKSRAHRTGSVLPSNSNKKRGI